MIFGSVFGIWMTGDFSMSGAWSLALCDASPSLPRLVEDMVFIVCSGVFLNDLGFGHKERTAVLRGDMNLLYQGEKANPKRSLGLMVKGVDLNRPWDGKRPAPTMDGASLRRKLPRHEEFDGFI